MYRPSSVRQTCSAFSLAETKYDCPSQDRSVAYQNRECRCPSAATAEGEAGKVAAIRSFDFAARGDNSLVVSVNLTVSSLPSVRSTNCNALPSTENRPVQNRGRDSSNCNFQPVRDNRQHFSRSRLNARSRFPSRAAIKSDL